MEIMNQTRIRTSKSSRGRRDRVSVLQGASLDTSDHPAIQRPHIWNTVSPRFDAAVAATNAVLRCCAVEGKQFDEYIVLDQSISFVGRTECVSWSETLRSYAVFPTEDTAVWVRWSLLNSACSSKSPLLVAAKVVLVSQVRDRVCILAARGAEKGLKGEMLLIGQRH